MRSLPHRPGPSDRSSGVANGHRPRRPLVGPALLLALLLLALAPAGADATSLITSFSAGVLVDENTANPQNSDFATQAGSHPDVAFTKFTLDTSLGSAQDVRVDLPPGLAVNPQAIPRCSASGTTLSTCPSDTRVGTSTVTIANVPVLGKQTVSGAVYNMTPPSGAPSDFAFEVTVGVLFTVRTDLVGGVRWYPSNGRPGDFGDYFTISEISNTLGTALERSELIFWGAPEEHNGGGAPNNAFLTNPTSCSGVQTTYITASTYAPVASGSASYTTPVGANGCESVPFSPSISVTPNTTQRDKPDGLAVDLHVPQDQNPSHTASSHLQEASVTLPAGMSLNPSAANGLSACSDAQFAAGVNAKVTCPAGSAAGTVEISTPLLASPLTGSIYVGEPLEGDPYRIFLDAENSVGGVAVRLTGSVTADPVTGQLRTTFTGNPQVPFTDLKLTFKTGAGALFANPLGCETATTTAILAPYSGRSPSTPTSAFTVDSNGSGGACPSPIPFAPTASATPTSTTAAGSTNLNVNLSRADGEQTLDTLTTRLPEGMLANLSGVTLCPEPAASQGTCTSASQIGMVTVTAGAGTTPLSLPGTVYFTGPYKGQPFGLSIVVPAIAGPYDLGTVVTRAAVAVDTTNGKVSITTDSLPTILKGIPLRLRTIAVAINKAGFLLDPTDCAPTATAGTVTSTAAQSQPFETPVTMTGCGSLPFAPTLTATPTTSERDAPTGLNVDLHLPSGSSDLHGALAGLPAGLTLNPAVAGGLLACTDAELGQGTNNPLGCPAASAVGTVEIDTPLLPSPLTGSLYVGRPLSNEPQSGQEYRLFLDAENATYGLSVRLIGLLSADPATGRLSASFPSTPPIPFTDIKLALNPGPHAPLANPQGCGQAAFTSTLTPTTGTPATPGSEYTVDDDGHGGPCPSAFPFAPAQSTADQPSLGGANSSFTLSLDRPDGQQYLSRVSTVLPPGLLGRIGAFTECPDAQAATGSCPSSSRIGSAVVGVGAGSSPLELPGSVYLTGPYEGAPFGLAVAIPAEAVGPFDFGTVVTRARIEVDEHTAVATVTSDPIPTIVGGAPLRLQTLTITTSQAFTVNPTNCAPTQTKSTLTSTENAVQSDSSPFQATGCSGLPFEPSFAVSTSAQASKQNGASLQVELGYPAEHEANLAAVSATLPTQLPARLSTLQKACPEATFAAGPSGCPAASQVGQAAVRTPLVSGGLEGPAYLVSNGGAAFPDLDLVLSGDGLRILLHGQTDIKGGRITTTFPAVPDVPFSHFTLTLPMGPYSVLGAIAALCGEELTMPTTLTGQNGSRVTRQVAISVTGCPPGTGGGASSLSAPQGRPLALRSGPEGCERRQASEPEEKEEGEAGQARGRHGLLHRRPDRHDDVPRPAPGPRAKARQALPGGIEEAARPRAPQGPALHPLQAGGVLHPCRPDGCQQLLLHWPGTRAQARPRQLPPGSAGGIPRWRARGARHRRLHDQTRLRRTLRPRR